MSFLLKNLAQRAFGTGPVSVRPFDELPPVGPVSDRSVGPGANGHPEIRPPGSGEIASAPADTCDYFPTHSLLGQSPEPILANGQPALPSSSVGKSARRRLFSLTDAGVAGDDAVIYVPSQRVAIEETVRQWSGPANRHPLLAAPRFPAAESLPGLSLSIGSLDAGGFYHFLMESLPRLHLAQGWLDQVDHVLANGSPGSFQERWLARAGIPTAKIRWLAGHTHFRCEQLLFTNLLCADLEPTPWLVAAIRSVLHRPNVERAGSRRIWISRSDAAARRFTAENSLLKDLNDFERVELARLSPADQIALMADASVIAGPHGAGLANLIFCAPGTRVIELMPDLRQRPLFGRLSIAVGCKHAWASVNFDHPEENVSDLASAIRAYIG